MRKLKLSPTRSLIHIWNTFPGLVYRGGSQIALHKWSGLIASQTLKSIAYNKQSKVMVLINNGSTHHFFNRKVVEEILWYVRPIFNFKIMIVNGGMMKCGYHYENAKLQMGYYLLKTHVFIIEMGGCDAVLGTLMDKDFGIGHHGFQGSLYKIQ